MTNHYRRAIELASVDKVFAQILTSVNPEKVLQEVEARVWLNLTNDMNGKLWPLAAIDAKQGIKKRPMDYSNDLSEVAEIEVVQSHFSRFGGYAAILAGAGEDPFTNYLYGINAEDFRALLKDKQGMDMAREIQSLYKEGIIAADLGGSKLHRYMEQLSLSYIPTVNHLNAARRGEITEGRYNMTKSRMK